MVFLNEKKKGLSPLIASVLLIVFTIGISAIIITWMNTYTKEMTYDANKDTSTIVDCTNTNIDIDGTYIITSDDVKTIARNTGHKIIYLKEAYIWDINGTNCNLNITNSELGVAESIQLINDSCDIDFTTGCSEFGKITVSTTCGVTATVDDLSQIVCNV